MNKAVVGRDQELAAAEVFLETVRDRSATLVIEGTAGIGKTTLWQETVERARARGMRVLASRPALSEARLSYAGLLDVLDGVDGEVFARLPAPQRRALDVALLRADADAPSTDQRSIATGFLAVIRTLSLSGPVLLAVDDVQWLDVPTWRVLEFAMRRLEPERIGLLAAARVDADAPDRFQQGHALPRDRVQRLSLGPLALAALHEILRAELGHSFARPTLVRIERASGGNPFFALELARVIIESGDPAVAPAAPTLTGDLVELVSRRLRRLPASARRALLVASALSQPTVEMLDRRAIARARDAGVVRVDERGRVTFTHPLLASAVYGSAPAERLRALHRELAGRVAGSEERARHLALAADGPEEAVAAALVAAAQAARERGAPDAAIELVELACERTPPGSDALLERRLELGRSLAGAGDPRRAKRVLLELADATPAAIRARALLLLGFLSEWADGSEAATVLCERALAAAGDDTALRAEIHAAASRICDHDAERKTAHAREAMALTRKGTTSPRLRAYALLAFAEAEFKAGRGLRQDVFDEAAGLESLERPPGAPTADRVVFARHLYSDVRPSDRLLGILRLYADELDPARALLERERQTSIEHGDDAQLSRTLARLATIELRAGRWTIADQLLREAQSVVARTEERVVAHRVLTLRAELEALRGGLAAARASAAEALEVAADAGWPWELATSLAARGFVALTAGDVAAARDDFDRVDERYRRCGLGEPSLFRHQADHVEALVAAGDAGRAAEPLERFAEQAARTGRPWALAAAARSRALVRSAEGDLDGALAAIDAALPHHERLPVPFELARTLMVKGQLHRRRKEKRLARDALAGSLGILERLGASVWAERARGELDRVGLQRRRPDELTSTQEQVASFAATGLTNRVIAERAFLSPKTVEANLARVYEKLGIHSRAELGRAMAQRERAGTK